MLGAHYSLSRCVCSDCTCTSRFHKLSISAPSSISAHLIGCKYGSDVQRASCFGPPSMLGACYSRLRCVCSYCRSVIYFSGPHRLLCSDVQQLRALYLRRCVAPTTRCCGAFALFAHAPHVVMAVDVSSFFSVLVVRLFRGTAPICSNVVL
jgi:hypothetical protein